MITLTATTEYKIFTDGDGCEDNDADSIKDKDKCTAAAKAVGIDKTATADGGTSGDAPAWCYVTKDGDLMFNEDKNTGECTADNTCICSKCAAGDGSVDVDLPEGAFTRIAEIPKDASGVKITVQSPKEGDAPAKGADLDVMLMEEDELPCLPADAKKATNDCKENVLLDSNSDPDPNYAKCLAFRHYLHYHIKAAKTNLHMRMRRKVRGWLQVLNRAALASEAPREKKTISGRTFTRK